MSSFDFAPLCCPFVTDAMYEPVCHDVYDVVLMHFPYVVHIYFIVEFMQRVFLSLNHPCWNYQDGW